MKLPKYLYRYDDRQRFTLQSNGYYTMDKSRMWNKYNYSYRNLIFHGFVDSLKKCMIQDTLPYENDGHGNGDFD